MNRKLHNTFSALSVATLLTAGGLIAATTAPYRADPVAVQSQTSTMPAGRAAPAPAKAQLARPAERSIHIAEARAKAAESAAQARAKDIEARAAALAKELEGNQNIGEVLGRVAGFTAEVATEAALDAAVEEFTSVETTEPYVAPPAPVRKSRQNRRSLAMPYFSFATRG